MLEKEWLLTCAPIGILEKTKQSWTPIAAGVFVYDNPFIWYVTSRQQICKNNDTPLYVLLRHKTLHQILFDISSMHKQENLDWVFDEQNNIAATLFPADPNFELKAIGFESFFASKDILPAMNCYSVSYPYILAELDAETVNPCVLGGIISRIDEPSKIYVTTPIFPDNYGSPLFVWKNPFNSSNSIILGNPSIYFGGIMTKTISTQANNDRSGTPLFQSINLGVMSSSELIQELLVTPKALSQKKKLKEKNGI